MHVAGAAKKVCPFTLHVLNILVLRVDLEKKNPPNELDNFGSNLNPNSLHKSMLHPKILTPLTRHEPEGSP